MSVKVVAVGVFLAVAGAAMLLLSREESRVRATVTAAAEALSARACDGDIDRLARLAGFARALARDVVVEVEPNGATVRGREAVTAIATQFGAAGGARQITLSDLAVAFDDDRSRATVTAVAHITAATTPGPASALDGEFVRIELVKAGDQWLIARVAAQAALTR